MLETQLARLESGELIRPLSEADLAYLFKHALVQDTARASLLLNERKRLHRMVGHAIETLYPERRVELASLLCQHFSAGGDDDKALEYAIIAGDAAARINANTEAQAHYTRAIQIAEHQSRPGALVRDLYLKRGRTLEVQNNFAAAIENYQALENFGVTRGDKSCVLGALMATATVHSIPSTAYNIERASELTTAALELARELDDKAAQATILWNMMLAESRVGSRFSDALIHGQQALEIALENNLVERTAYIKNDIGPLLIYAHHVDQAIRYNLEARETWKHLENMPMLSGNYGYSVMIHVAIGNYDTAIADAQEGLRLSREINNSWNEAFNQSWIGQAYFERGDIATAERVMQTSVAMGETVFPPTLVITRSDLALLYSGLGMYDKSIALANQALDVANKRFLAIRAAPMSVLISAYLAAGRLNDARDVALDTHNLTAYGYNPLVGVRLTAARIQVQLADHEFALALESSETLLTFLTDNGLRQYMPDLLMSMARAQQGLAEVEPAAESLRRALALALDMRAQWSLWQVYAALARLERGRGNAELAAQYHSEARALIDSIAARTPKEYQATFLERAARAL